MSHEQTLARSNRTNRNGVYIYIYSIPVGSAASSSWFNRCWSIILGEENFILHSSHSNSFATWLLSLFALSFSFGCVFDCNLKLCNDANALLQTIHLKDFSVVWIFYFLSHLKGLSPLWVLLSITKSLDSINPFSQTSHLKGVIPVWISLWFVKLAESTYALSQTSHLKASSPVFVLLCGAKALDLRNALSQISYLKGLPQCKFFYAVLNNLTLQMLCHRYHKYEKAFP